jgi:tetratricopeptide (TPR) repeat protein
MKNIAAILLLMVGLLWAPQLVLAQGGQAPAKEALTLMRNKAFDQALDKINEAIRLEPSNSQYYFIKGQCEVQLKKFAEAKSSFTDAVSKNKGNTKAYLMLAKLSIKDKDENTAIRYLNDAYENEQNMSKKIAYKLYVIRLLTSAKRYQEALGEADRLKAEAGNEARITVAIAKIYEKMDRWADAATTYEGLLAQLGPSASQTDKDKYNASLAIALARSGNKTKADEVAALITDPKLKNYYKAASSMNSSRYQIFLATPYIKVGEYDEALKYLEKAIELGDDPGTSNMYAAIVYAKKGQNSQAINYFQTAANVEKDPAKLNKIYAQLVGLQFKNGDLAGAISTASKILAKEPANINILFLKAQAEYQSNRFGDAVTSLEEAIRQGETKNPKGMDQFYFLLGLAAKRDGNTEKAKTALQKVVNTQAFRAAAKKQMEGLK